MTNTIKKVIIGVFVSSVSISVYAACGDSTCGWKGKDFACVVQTPGGGTRTCTSENPCDINCN
ncbi:hypothetical protein H5085_08360 [Pseudoalteromonas sp. SR43-6]|uniref:hypothetical protein n=1 Tax=Pseudoalteromonas TaxID=53246 RepID=UPI000C31C0D5|nr:MULTISPECIES: hypothetical protein [Pseudoalteromonas]MBB1288192.1 hypothetical protein [Pseudoalteromonas sp. SR41-5]MBB1374331.1 hypothetical protein [Pseudoalteromonas sp. SR43-6]MBB1413472.1 hypothetical protein [Pseudoalteromonas sp. SG43-8]PKG64688.1 hypothetical protein CXF75_10640 [Pseudoalteromonas arctica]PKG71795.1 hypothetical protein CXF64_04265 [Pseudoalteromonas sp. GutCa3]